MVSTTVSPAERVGELPRIEDPEAVSPVDARAMSKLFFDRLQELEEGTHEYAYARNTLIEMNMSLVHFAARRFNRRDQVEDMIQVGMIGLIKAIDRFDLSRENEFATFAVPYIVGEIKRFFRDSTWAVHVPRRLQEMRVELAKARDRLSCKLDREPTVAELAAELGRPEEEVIDGLIAANGYSTDSLDMPYDSGEGSARKSATLADSFGACDPGMELVEDLTSLAPLLAELDDRDRTILEMRFGREWTQSEIGEALGISQMHVSRLLGRTLKTLRSGMLTQD
ncbi:SigB/SigF/SigG family RNA polymerase sigma factor [Streptomyces montanisoli]|uniref:SigB/SigF/SigG family RNA polymerase sigma factor n=1 Tax=Streptomyces montanisoli TaxID=2798581 RepID=A0A940MHU8_9ACTN|nr:SigB/SigF/SigG family RNA polymerase sigma factor [Streptomyces montanisoli]MBP0459927.1 SigB/SigF/SigG family RNA polymerase sigma factor [Streptomyces montanisoli]